MSPTATDAPWGTETGDRAPLGAFGAGRPSGLAAWPGDAWLGRLDRRVGVYLVAAAAANGLLSIGGRIGWDFHAYWMAAQSVASGGSAYAETLAIGADRWGSGQTYVYPPFLAHVLAPLTLLPEPIGFAVWSVAGALILAASLGAVNRSFCRFGTVGTPTFRRYPRLVAGMGVLWIALSVGQVNLFVLAGLLLALGHRDDRAAGIGLALAVLLRGTPAVFALLLAFDRRWRALGWACAGTAAGLLVGAVDLAAFVDLSGTLATLPPVHSIWQTSLAAVHPGLSVGAALLVAVIIAAARRVPGEARLIRGTVIGAGLLLVPGSAWFHWVAFAGTPLFLEGHSTAWGRRILLGYLVAGLLLVPVGSWATSLVATAGLLALGWRVARPPRARDGAADLPAMGTPVAVSVAAIAGVNPGDVVRFEALPPE
jgi:hypothetical protein